MKKIISITLAAIFILSCLAGCGSSASNSKGVVNVYNWGEYIDEELLTLFEKETGIKVNYKTYESNEQMYSVLKQGGVSYDVIIPSDYMISRLIDENMLEKLDFSNIPNFSKIDKSLVGMEYDPTAEYSVPYAWGTVGLIYNSTVVTEDVTSWSTLFDPAYSGQILMFDNPRDAVGIALKYLGYSQNTTSEAEVREAFDLLEQQKPILQGYVMDQIFDKLESGEAAIGPYYAGDYLSMLENNPDLRFVIPEEGSNKFVDCMCIPKGAENKANAEAFINYMCTAEASKLNIEVIGYTSPVVEVESLLDLSDSERAVMYPSSEILDRCEFFTNLPQNILNLYDELWVKVKS